MNPNPVFVSQRIAIQTNYRVAQYLLCPACEERLNQGGETWVLSNAHRGDRMFPLRDALQQAKPFLTLPSVILFAGDETAGVNLDNIIYFALSVFWKASATKWSTFDGPIKLNLGPYAERIRRFLLGDSMFPEKCAIVVNVSGSENPHLVSIFPYSGRCDGAWQHRFAIPGMTFWLHVGELPSSLSAICASRSRVICLVPNLDEVFVREVKWTFNRAKPTGGLRAK